MKKILLLILIFTQSFVFAQNEKKTDSHLSVLPKNNYDRFKQKTFKKSKKLELSNEKSIEFESQGEYHSTYLILYDNKDFVYYSVFEGGFDVCFGKWEKSNDKEIILNWDKEKTLQNIKNKSIIDKMFKYSFPSPIKMESWMFKIPE